MKQSEDYSTATTQSQLNVDVSELVNVINKYAERKYAHTINVEEIKRWTEIVATNKAIGKVAKIFKNIYTLEALVKLLNPEFPNINTRQFLHHLRTEAEGGEKT